MTIQGQVLDPKGKPWTSEQLAKFVQEHMRSDPRRLTFVIGDYAGLPPEILLIPLSGHTRGHAGVAVDTGDGWLLNAGDSFFFHGQIDASPRCPAGLKWFEGHMETVKGARLDNHRRLRQLVQEHGDEVTVFAAHDETEFLRLSTSDNRGFAPGRGLRHPDPRKTSRSRV